MSNNTLADLNRHLFLQLERPSEDCMTLEQIEAEAKRADAIVDIADQVIRNADLQLKAANLIATHGDRFKPMLPALGGPSE
jgi:hypothetical protein